MCVYIYDIITNIRQFCGVQYMLVRYSVHGAYETANKNNSCLRCPSPDAAVYFFRPLTSPWSFQLETRLRLGMGK